MAATPQLSVSLALSGTNYDANNSRFSGWGMGALVVIGTAVVEDRISTKYHQAATVSDLWVRCVTNTRDDVANVTLRIDGSDGNSTVEIPAMTTGAFHDEVNTDSISGGERLGYRIRSNHSTSSFTGFNLTIIQTVVTPTAGGNYLYRCANDGWAAGGGQDDDGFLGLIGGGDGNADEVNVQHTCPAGTFRNLWVNVTGNSGTGSADYVLRKNGSDTALALSIPAATTGQFEDTSTTITSEDGDRFCIRVDENISGLFVIDHGAVDFRSDTFWGGGTRGGSGVTLNAGTPTDHWAAHTGQHSGTTTDEDRAKAEVLIPDAVWNGLIFYVVTNTADVAAQWEGRVNGVPTDWNAVVPAGTTGWFETEGDPATLDTEDLINIRRFIAAGSGSVFYMTHTFRGLPDEEEVDLANICPLPTPDAASGPPFICPI